MLVLTRQINQTIMIGDDIEITIVGIKGGKVRIGIQAPHFIPVHRKEVYLAIKQANIEAAKAEVDVIDKLSKIKKLALQVKHKKPGG